jgi:hypothetical protein
MAMSTTHVFNKHDSSKDNSSRTQQPNLISKMRNGVLSFTAKCSDLFFADIVDRGGYEVCDYTGYVPDFMPGEHFGDYVELDIEIATGKILNWRVPTKEQLKRFSNECDLQAKEDNSSRTQQLNRISRMRNGVLSFTALCADLFFASIVDEDGYKVCEYRGYVPDFMPGEHGGDYVELDIEIATGKILNWRVPTKEQLKRFLKECDIQAREE